jgi:hypothetical protein
MHKKTLVLSVALLMVIFVVSSCKKSSTAKVNPNGPHALSDPYYVRGILDTTWEYLGNTNKEECQTTGAVCADFLTYGPGATLLGIKFQLTDSAHPAPKDTTILSWVGKTFVTSSDTAASHAYTFSFDYPDSLGREMSTDYILNNTGARLTVQSVVANGVSQYYLDSVTPYKAFIITGTISAKLTHFGDTIVHHFTQGVYSINVIEAK